MKTGGGKQKGSQFERKVCVQLSLWVSNGKSEDLFWRSAMSGGRATLGARKGKALRRQAGDVSAVSAEGCVLTNRYYIECKFVKRLSLESFMIKAEGPLMKYWDEALRGAILHHKTPMLIAKQNQLPVIVLARVNDLPCDPLIWVNDVYICLFDDMLQQPFKETQ